MFIPLVCKIKGLEAVLGAKRKHAWLQGPYEAAWCRLVVRHPEDRRPMLNLLSGFYSTGGVSCHTVSSRIKRPTCKEQKFLPRPMWASWTDSLQPQRSLHTCLSFDIWKAKLLLKSGQRSPAWWEGDVFAFPEQSHKRSWWCSGAFIKMAAYLWAPDHLIQVLPDFRWGDSPANPRLYRNCLPTSPESSVPAFKRM